MLERGLTNRPSATKRQTEGMSRLAWLFISLTRTLFGERECLFESTVMANALRAMGYDAHVVIGHHFVSSLAGAPMHAWVEVGGRAIFLRDRGNDLRFIRVLAFPQRVG